MTINDMDERYYSQYFRRYGQNITEREIEELSMVSAVLSPLRKKPTPLQILSDCVCVSAGRPMMYSFVAAQIFVSFMSELLNACNRSESSVSFTVIRNKLSAVSDSLNAGSNRSVIDIEHLISALADSYRHLDFVQDNTTTSSRRIPAPLSETASENLTQTVSSFSAFPKWLYPVIVPTIISVYNGNIPTSASRMEVETKSRAVASDLPEEELDETDHDVDDDGEIERFKEKVRLVQMDRDESIRKLQALAPFEDI